MKILSELTTEQRQLLRELSEHAIKTMPEAMVEIGLNPFRTRFRPAGVVEFLTLTEPNLNFIHVKDILEKLGENRV